MKYFKLTAALIIVVLIACVVVFTNKNCDTKNEQNITGCGSVETQFEITSKYTIY